MLDDSNYHLDPEWNRFLQQIAASPYDRMRRMIAADWLEENGLDPCRVAFIRSQCARSESGEGYAASPVYSDLEMKLLIDTGPVICPTEIAERDQQLLHPMVNHKRWGCTWSDDKDYFWNLETSFSRNILSCWYEDGFPSGLIIAVGSESMMADKIKPQILSILEKWPIRTLLVPVRKMGNNYIVTTERYFLTSGGNGYVYADNLSSFETTGIAGDKRVRQWIEYMRDGDLVFPSHTYAPALINPWAYETDVLRNRGRRGREGLVYSILAFCRRQGNTLTGGDAWHPKLLPGF